jgi:hypothetical protein
LYNIVMLCRTIDYGVPTDAPAGVDGLEAAVPFYMLAPGWMPRMQKVGTEGIVGHWNGSDDWPDVVIAREYMWAHVRAGDKVNLTALQEWVMPRYKRWQADRSDVITMEEAFNIVLSDGPIWIKSKEENARKNLKKMDVV